MTGMGMRKRNEFKMILEISTLSDQEMVDHYVSKGDRHIASFGRKKIRSFLGALNLRC